MSELPVILEPSTIRARTKEIFDEALQGGTAFSVDLSKLPAVVALVLDVTRRNYPSGEIPYHGRFEHFRVGGIDRVAELGRLLPSEPAARARAFIDLVLVSVLLDAGAGDAWRYREGSRGTWARSEGLAVASFELFCAGAFSHDPAAPYQVTATGLERLTAERVAQGFQVSKDNPLLGLDGRVSLLQRLAVSLRAFPEYFGAGEPRPGHLLDALRTGQTVQARAVLQLLLLGLSRMWPPRVSVGGVGFGDVWLRDGRLVPFHKLSQWLTYSLLEPIEQGGVKVTGVEELTGLPEYRNGGLFLDLGVLTLRDPGLAKLELEASHPAIIEWRALTVQLLDRVGDEVRRALGKTAEALPLARVLQGGTWSAGREIARQLRPATGGPPLTLKSDGMVF
jgi:hypothetical protein